jgi:hypothetical protein
MANGRPKSICIFEARQWSEFQSNIKSFSIQSYHFASSNTICEVQETLTEPIEIECLENCNKSDPERLTDSMTAFNGS